MRPRRNDRAPKRRQIDFPPPTPCKIDPEHEAAVKMAHSGFSLLRWRGLNRHAAVIALCLLFPGLAMAAPADGPEPARPALQHLTERLQKNSADEALRERIIKLAREMRPAPALSKEALRHAERGALALKDATTEQGYLDAAHEYEQASLLAPWAADLYRHVGIAYEKAGDVGMADILTGSQVVKTCSSDERAREWERLKLRSLSKQYFKWYLLARPDALDAGKTRHRVDLRDLEFVRWQWAWDQQCCLGCGGTQRSPR